MAIIKKENIDDSYVELSKLDFYEKSLRNSY